MKTYTSLTCMALLGFCASGQTLPKGSASPGETAGRPAAMPGSQTTASASPSPSAGAERAIPFHGTISAVDAKAKSFTTAGKEKSRTFKITDRTVITKNGRPATIKDVSAKADARGSYWKMPDGSMEVKVLKLAPAAEQEKAKSGGSDKKKQASPSLRLCRSSYRAGAEIRDTGYATVGVAQRGRVEINHGAFAVGQRVLGDNVFARFVFLRRQDVQVVESRCRSLHKR